MTKKTILSMISIMVIGIQTAHAGNVVVDMSQVQDYNQYQMDLQQCEGLAVQNQLILHSKTLALLQVHLILVVVLHLRHVHYHVAGVGSLNTDNHY